MDAAPSSSSPPPPEDVRQVGWIVAGLLAATGAPSEPELRHARIGLARLGLPTLPPSLAPLLAGDARPTPEQLAPLVPVAARAGLLALLDELAGEEPLRRRFAEAYARLWSQPTAPVAAAPKTPPTGGRVLRWLVGELPHHHATEEQDMSQLAPGGVYRTSPVGPHLPAAAPEPPSLRQRIERVRDEFERVVASVERVVIGKREVIERVLVAMAARGHVLLVDVPGVGKTQLCKAIAASLDVRFGRVQFTPDLLPLDVVGGAILDGRTHELRFRPGPVFCHLLLADEINRATPKTQSALLEVMEERAVTVDGTTHPLEEPFTVLATMNPLDHHGTYALPAAQIDRFLVMLELGVPSPEDEVRVLDAHLAPVPPLSRLEPVVGRPALVEWRAIVPLVHVSPDVKRSAVDAANALRRPGASGHEPRAVSPRATIAWVRCAQAHAMLQGREFVTLEDLAEVAPHVLRHRIGLSPSEVRDRVRPLLAPAGGAR